MAPHCQASPSAVALDVPHALLGQMDDTLVPSSLVIVTLLQ